MNAACSETNTNTEIHSVGRKSNFLDVKHMLHKVTNSPSRVKVWSEPQAIS